MRYANIKTKKDKYKAGGENESEGREVLILIKLSINYT